MSFIATDPGLSRHLLELAASLERGQALHARYLSDERQKVLVAMEELLRNGFALGSLLRGETDMSVVDASLYAITSKGRDLLEQLTCEPATAIAREP
jgi:hypothetical protein